MMQSRKNRGFGLVEIMVGLVIGMIASIVVFQVFASAERQKRGTTGAADAQTNGAISLSMMERDIQAAGWGLEGSTFSGCERVFSYFDAGSAPGAIANLLVPALITDGGSSPDQISIRYFDDPANANYKFSITSLAIKPGAGSDSLIVKNTYGCTKPTPASSGRLALIQQSGNCTLMQITKYDKATLTLWHEAGATTPSYNPPPAYATANGWPTYDKGAYLQCFPQLTLHTYRVNNRQLELQIPDNSGTTQTLQVAPEIMDFQAQYGVTDICGAAPCPQKITSWVDATGAWASPLSNANTKRIKALRVAIVARSAEFEKPESDGICNTTTAEAVTKWSTWATFNTNAYPDNWQCYRYKVFETVIPLRNVIWDKV